MNLNFIWAFFGAFAFTFLIFASFYFIMTGSYIQGMIILITQNILLYLIFLKYFNIEQQLNEVQK